MAMARETTGPGAGVLRQADRDLDQTARQTCRAVVVLVARLQLTPRVGADSVDMYVGMSILGVIWVCCAGILGAKLLDLRDF